MDTKKLIPIQKKQSKKRGEKPIHNRPLMQKETKKKRTKKTKTIYYQKKNRKKKRYGVEENPFNKENPLVVPIKKKIKTFLFIEYKPSSTPFKRKRHHRPLSNKRSTPNFVFKPSVFLFL